MPLAERKKVPSNYGLGIRIWFIPLYPSASLFFSSTVFGKATTTFGKIIQDDPNQSDIGEVTTRVALAVVDRRIILGTPVEVANTRTGACEVTACKHPAVQPTKSIVKGPTPGSV